MLGIVTSVPSIQQALNNVHRRNGPQTKHEVHGWEDGMLSSYHCPTHLAISNVILPQASRKGLNKSDSVSTPGAPG